MTRLGRFRPVAAAWLFALTASRAASAPDALPIADCDDPAQWRCGATGGSKISLRIDEEDRVEGRAAAAIRYDLKPGSQGAWWFCNVPLPEDRRDWTRFKSLVFHLKGDGGGNSLRIGLKDREGELLLSERVFRLSGQDWQRCEINLNDIDGFYSSDLYQPDLFFLKGAGTLDLDGVQELQLQVQDTWADSRKGSLKIDGVSLSERPAAPAPAELVASLPDEWGVCQAGYRSSARKVAVLATPRPCDTSDFDVVAAEGESVFRGSLGFWGTKWGRRLYVADFTGLRQAGRFRLRAGRKLSAAFTISANPWQAVPTERFFSSFFGFQRCQEEQQAEPRNADGTHADLDRNLPVYQVETGGAEVVTDRRHPDALGGWHDSTATDKESGIIAWTAHMLLLAWEYNPDLFQASPATGPDRPAILDEARWGLSYLFKMQDEDGGVLLAVKPFDWWREAAPPRRVLGNKCAGVTAKAVAAWAAAYPVFRERDPEFAQKCLAGARRGWAWIAQHPKAFTPGDTYPSYWTGDPSSVTLAACELFRATAAEWPEEAAAYRQRVSEDLRKGRFRNGVWVYSPCLQSSSYVHTAIHGQIVPAMCRFFPSAAADEQELIRAHLRDWTVPWFKKSRNNPYGVAENLLKSFFGMNGWCAEVALDMLLAGRTLGEARMWDFGVAQLEWLFGNNPFGMSFVVGVGERSFPTPFKRPVDRSIGGVIPGVLDCDNDGVIEIDGINEWQTDEPTIDYTGALMLDVALASCPPPGRAP